MTYLYAFIAFLVVLLGISTYYALKFGVLILKFQDALEESLDVIDEKYASITSICERPLFYDSPEVRKVLMDIKDTRSSLHQIALALSRDFEADESDIKIDGHLEG